MRRIIQQFVYPDDLTNIAFKMVDDHRLANNPNTPLDLLDIKYSEPWIVYVICAKNKHIDRQFILDNIRYISDKTIWKCLVDRITINLGMFSKLPGAVQSYLIEHHIDKLNIPKKSLIDHCKSSYLEHIAASSLTEDEIEYILTRHYSGVDAYGLYSELAVHQHLTQHHLDIMKKRNYKATAMIISKYY
jgi:hypothetical protein